MKNFIIECKHCGSSNCDIMGTESDTILVYCLVCDNQEDV